MSKSVTKLFFLVLIFCVGDSYCQQKPRFYDEIQAFKKQDSLHFPKKNSILLVGSSSFRFWTSAQADFPAYPILNRGFGGATLLDMIRYANDIILPYNPKQILIYCGENDLGESDTMSVQTVVNHFKQLYGILRKGLGNNVNISYVSMKPSVLREKIMPKLDAANLKIKAFLAVENNTQFIDVYHAMLTKDGVPMPEIFRDDKLHMKQNGYAIWQKTIEPYLVN